VPAGSASTVLGCCSPAGNAQSDTDCISLFIVGLETRHFPFRSLANFQGQLEFSR
jgi:hypothetical protein